MNYKNTIEILTKDIQDIGKLVSNFKNYSSIPAIELDLVLSKIRNVYDVILELKEPPVLSGNDEIPTEIRIKKEENLNLMMDQKPVETPTAHAEKQIKEGELLSSEITQVEKKEIVDEDRKKVVPLIKPGRHSKEILAEKFASERSVVNEKLGQQTLRADISAMHQVSSIKTISGSIGINDKFYFVRELFKGDAELFRQTLQDLDHSADFNDACSLLNGRFSWDMESESVQLLLNLVRRKFISPSNE